MQILMFRNRRGKSSNYRFYLLLSNHILYGQSRKPTKQNVIVLHFVECKASLLSFHKDNPFQFIRLCKTKQPQPNHKLIKQEAEVSFFLYILHNTTTTNKAQNLFYLHTNFFVPRDSNSCIIF